MDSLLKVENLNISYKTQDYAVKNVSFTVSKGEILSVVGESGSGKSTLIRSILGLLSEEGKIESGKIYFEGRDIVNLKRKQISRLRGTEIGMIFQDAGSSMNPIRKIGGQFVEYIRTHNKMSKKEAKDLATLWLNKLKLDDAERILLSYPFELSGGMKQRVNIGMVMSQKPRLLLADEPTSALDAMVQLQVIRELKRMNKEYGTSIIIVTHNIRVASYLADKIGVMKDGELVEFGLKEKIIGNPENEYTELLLKSVPKLQ